MSILDLIFHSSPSQSSLATKVLGCFFLMLGGTGGAFFLFQALAPVLGYWESGSLICGILMILSGFFLWPEKRTPSPQEEIEQKLISFLNNLNVEKTLKNNAFKLSLLSFGLGVVLSQIKNIKNFLDFYKTTVK